jgi:hypothetical protein
VPSRNSPPPVTSSSIRTGCTKRISRCTRFSASMPSVFFSACQTSATDIVPWAMIPPIGLWAAKALSTWIGL